MNHQGFVESMCLPCRNMRTSMPTSMRSFGKRSKSFLTCLARAKPFPKCSLSVCAWHSHKDVHVPLQQLGYYGPGPIAGQWDPKLFAGFM